VGGLVGCLSALRMLEVFVFDRPALHVHMRRGASRMRSPKNRNRRLPPRRKRRIVLHWHPLRGDPVDGRVSVIDALIHAVRCQPARHAIASLDSALNKGVLSSDELGEIFAALPEQYQVLRRFVDGRAQAGTETLVRLAVLGLNCSVDLQVEFEGVGFVDLLVDGWLVIECDSKQFHSDWKQQVKDYRRDLELARRGYCVLRLTAEDILYHPEIVLDALRGLLAGTPARA
jgi:very-short-patch-repair endonuclease